MRYELALPSWDQSEINAIYDVIKTGMYSMGNYVQSFERKFSEYINSKFCVMVNSGSSANLLMVAALFYHSKYRLNHGDEIIVPAVSWSTTYFPLYQYGLKLKFVDIDLHTLNYNVDSLKRAVSGDTKAIMAPNLLGNPNEFNDIFDIISGKDIILLEDNCESMGSSYNGKKTGTFGLAGTFSTFFSHHMSTMEGGMVVTDDEEMRDILLSLRSHGWTRNLSKVNSLCRKDDNPFNEQFRFILPGYNVRPLEMSGAIGLRQLEKLESFVAARRKNAKTFNEIFKNDDRFIFQRETGESSWFGFSFIIKDRTLDRDAVLGRLSSAGIDTRPIVAGNFANKEVVQKYFDYEVFEHLQNAEYMDTHGFFVGNHHFDITDKLIYLKETLDTL